jgi:ribose transport system substrate-binding protein
MKSIRRTAAALTAVGIVSSLAACGNGPASSPSSGGKTTVAFVLPTATQPYWVAMKLAAQKEADKLGINLLMQAPQTVSASDQNSVVNLLMNKNPDAMISTPLDPQLSEPPLKAAAAKIPVLTVDIQVADPSFLTQQVTSDNTSGGTMAAKALTDAMGGSGKVLVLPANATSSTARARAEAFSNEIKKNSGVAIVGTQYSNEDPSGTQSKVNNVLLANPDLTGIFATEDEGCVGAMAAIRAKGLAGKVKLVCYDANKDEVEGLKSGEVTALVAQRPDQEIQMALESALAAVKKQGGIQKSVQVANTLMTKANLSDTVSLTYPTQ